MFFTATKSFRQSINEERFVYYGLAILLVVIYHLYCNTKLWFLTPFACGAIGVDVFLFFSGYGLCFSFEKNTLKDFYWRRFKRIMPIFWIHFFFTVIEYYVCGGAKFTFFEFLANFLCIPPFYGIGGTFVDWFTAAILQFYLFFPLLYFIVKKAPISSLIISTILSGYLLYSGNLTWQQYCFVCRIPIFLFGILFHLYSKKQSRLKWLVALSAMFGLAIVFWRHVPYRAFLIYALICPLFIYFLYLIVENKYILRSKIVESFYSRVRSFGESSLEIYYGNGNAGIAMRFCQNSYEIFFFYTVLTLLYSYVLYCVNKEFKRIF